jgi:hypothetical protein
MVGLLLALLIGTLGADAVAVAAALLVGVALR